MTAVSITRVLSEIEVSPAVVFKIMAVPLYHPNPRHLPVDEVLFLRSAFQFSPSGFSESPGSRHSVFLWSSLSLEDNLNYRLYLYSLYGYLRISVSLIPGVGSSIPSHFSLEMLLKYIHPSTWDLNQRAPSLFAFAITPGLNSP